MDAEVQQSDIIGSSEEEIQKVLHNIKVDGKISADDLNSYKTFSEVKGKAEKQEKVLATFEKTHENESILRKKVAYLILGALFVELCAGNAAFFFIGYEQINIEEWVAQTFFVGMYVQVIGLVTLVVRSLFPVPKKDYLTQIMELTDKL